MKNKINKWILKNEKKLNVLNEIFDRFFFIFAQLTISKIMFAGFQMGELKKANIVIISMVLETLIVTILICKLEKIIDKEQAKRKENENEKEKEN